MITVEEALAKLLALVSPLGEEQVPLARAAGRVLARPVSARRDQPPFDASAMDGYAIRGLAAGPGARFRVIGEAGAGHAFTGSIGEGEAARIFTGAPLPAGADRVVIQEDVTREGDWITLGERLDPGTNIRPRGGDFATGATVAAPRRLAPSDLALLAAMNLPEVPAIRRPVVAFIATGDELVMPGEEPGPDQIVASNSFALAALAEAAGAEARLLPIARDSEAELRAVLGMAVGADLVVTIGGASVGDHDLVGKVAGEMGMERAFYKVAMRPGKPLMAGRLNGAALLGLPGNPVSAIVCGHVFMLPVLRAMQGLPPAAPPLRATLAEPVGPTGPRTHFMRARLAPGPGLPAIAPFARQDSSLLSILTEADALLIRPKDGGPLPAGAEVDYLPMRS